MPWSAFAAGVGAVVYLMDVPHDNMSSPVSQGDQERNHELSAWAVPEGADVAFHVKQRLSPAWPIGEHLVGLVSVCNTSLRARAISDALCY